jgi:uncharacterized membrane protein YidH (DUF202 family)
MSSLAGRCTTALAFVAVGVAVEVLRFTLVGEAPLTLNRHDFLL